MKSDGNNEDEIWIESGEKFKDEERIKHE